jgi:hypothetical protein
MPMTSPQKQATMRVETDGMTAGKRFPEALSLILAESPQSPGKDRSPLPVNSPTIIAFNRRLTVNPYAASPYDTKTTIKRKPTMGQQSPDRDGRRTSITRNSMIADKPGKEI